jgi:hypothetical protein
MDIYVALITVIVVGMTALILLATKYLKKNYNISTEEISKSIDLTKLIAMFIGQKLIENSFENEKAQKILPIIINSLEYIKVAKDNYTSEEVLKDALDMIKDIAWEYDIVITESETVIIETVLKLANDFYMAHETSK